MQWQSSAVGFTRFAHDSTISSKDLDNPATMMCHHVDKIFTNNQKQIRTTG